MPQVGLPCRRWPQAKSSSPTRNKTSHRNGLWPQTRHVTERSMLCRGLRCPIKAIPPAKR
eukprot:1418011-Pyramimonas_sp.AAC.1